MLSPQEQYAGGLVSPAARGGRFISSIRSIDLRFIDGLVDFFQAPGFVPDVSNASFSDFFASEVPLDLYEIPARAIPLNHVLERRVRRAAETGSPFVRVPDLFPH